MGLITSFLKLLKPERGDFYNSQSEQAENWDKVDVWAEKVGNPENLTGESENIVAEVNNNNSNIELNKAAILNNTEQIESLLERSYENIESSNFTDGNVRLFRCGKARTLSFNNVIFKGLSVSNVIILSSVDRPAGASIYGALGAQGGTSGYAGEFDISTGGGVSIYVSDIVPSYKGSVTYFVD